MDKTKLDTVSTQRKKAQVRGLIYVAILCLFMVSITALIYVTLRDDIYREIDEAHLDLVSNLEDNIHDRMDKVSEYALHLSQFPGTKKALGGDLNALYDTASVMKTICDHNEGIDQFRLLDQGGREVIRVNVDDEGQASIVETENLQDKSGRYYYKEGIQAKAGDVYVSRLDLNVENGKVEIPYKPVLRLAVPVDSDGDRIGLVVLNYKADVIFEMMEEDHAHSSDDLVLLNDEGYYLKAFDDAQAFGFNIQGQETSGFFSDHPQKWSGMKNSDMGKYETNKAWMYYKRIQPMKASTKTSQTRDWFIIVSVPHAEIREELEHLILGLQIGNIVLMPLFIILGWTLGHYQIKNKYYKLTLENQARVDPLTGLYNRRHAGELLQYNIDLMSRQNGDLSLVYIDLNNLKYVNDTFGHEMGDLMITSAADVMVKNVRKTDVVARMGGDEFMIVLPDCTLSKLNEIMARIESSFEKIGWQEAKQNWSMSWGFSQWSSGEDTMNTFIDRADNAMYKHKENYRKGQSKNGD